MTAANTLIWDDSAGPTGTHGRIQFVQVDKVQMFQGSMYPREIAGFPDVGYNIKGRVKTKDSMDTGTWLVLVGDLISGLTLLALILFFAFQPKVEEAYRRKQAVKEARKNNKSKKIIHDMELEAASAVELVERDVRKQDPPSHKLSDVTDTPRDAPSLSSALKEIQKYGEAMDRAYQATLVEQTRLKKAVDAAELQTKANQKQIAELTQQLKDANETLREEEIRKKLVIEERDLEDSKGKEKKAKNDHAESESRSELVIKQTRDVRKQSSLGGG